MDSLSAAARSTIRAAIWSCFRPSTGDCSSAAINAPYFTGNPGDPFKAWDSSLTFDYMPKQWHHFPLGVRLSPRECALLDRSRRNHAAGFGRSALYQQRISAVLCLQRREFVRSIIASAAPKRPAERKAAVYGSPICGKTNASRLRHHGQVLSIGCRISRMELGFLMRPSDLQTEVEHV